VSVESLIGFEWQGFNVAGYTKLTGQKFIKGFFRSKIGVEGYNIKVRRNGLEERWIEQPSPEHPKRFGFYLVGSVKPGSKDELYPNALLLDYAASPRNSRWALERLLRSYLTQPDRTDPDLLIGKAYCAIGQVRWYATFFLLERLRATSWTPGR
jgi:hypothetical protein